MVPVRREVGQSRAKLEVVRLRPIESRGNDSHCSEERGIRSQEGEARHAGLYWNGGGTSRMDEEEQELD